MADTLDDPLAQMRLMIADARQAFARDVDVLLQEIQTLSASFGGAIGEISRQDALLALRRVVLEKFDECLPPRPTVETVQLIRLVRDAHRLLNNDLEKLSWRDDVKDWTRAAKPFVQS